MRLCAAGCATLLTIAALTGIVQAEPSPIPVYHVVRRIPIADGWWSHAAFDPVHRRLFIGRHDGVLMLDVGSGRVDQRFIPGSEARTTVVLPGTSQVMTMMDGYSDAILYDGVSGDIVKLFDFREAPDGAVWEPVTKQVWAIGWHGELTFVDPATQREDGTLELGDALETAVADGKGRVFINGSGRNALIVVDARRRVVVGRFAQPGCEGPSGLAYLGYAGILVSACGNDRITVLDSTTGALRQILRVGQDPGAVISDPVRRRVLVPSSKDGMLTVFSVDGSGTLRISDRIRIGTGARTGAVDPRSGALFIPVAKMTPPNKLGFGEPVPGTQQLLVLAPH